MDFVSGSLIVVVFAVILTRCWEESFFVGFFSRASRWAMRATASVAFATWSISMALTGGDIVASGNFTGIITILFSTLSGNYREVRLWWLRIMAKILVRWNRVRN